MLDGRARKWSATIQSATPTYIQASWIFMYWISIGVTMLAGPCKAISASCYTYQYFFIIIEIKIYNNIFITVDLDI